MSFEARDSALVSKSWFDRKSSHGGERINMSWLGTERFGDHVTCTKHLVSASSLVSPDGKNRDCLARFVGLERGARHPHNVPRTKGIKLKTSSAF